MKFRDVTVWLLLATHLWPAFLLGVFVAIVCLRKIKHKLEFSLFDLMLFCITLSGSMLPAAMGLFGPAAWFFPPIIFVGSILSFFIARCWCDTELPPSFETILICWAIVNPIYFITSAVLIALVGGT